MSLVSRRRTAESTEVRRDWRVALRRGAAGASFLTAASALAWGVGGWAWALAGLMAIPGAFTFVSIRRPYVAACPGCGALLGTEVFHLPDEPLIGPSFHEYRCTSCGIYVDGARGTVREVPFSRSLDHPGYTLWADASALDSLVWAEGCVACQREAVRWLRLADLVSGELSGRGAVLLSERPDREFVIPYCAAHGEGESSTARTVVVARAGARLTVQFMSYAVYRGFLDDNRDRVDVTVRSSALDAPQP